MNSFGKPCQCLATPLHLPCCREVTLFRNEASYEVIFDCRRSMHSARISSSQSAQDVCVHMMSEPMGPWADCRGQNRPLQGSMVIQFVESKRIFLSYAQLGNLKSGKYVRWRRGSEIPRYCVDIIRFAAEMFANTEGFASNLRFFGMSAKGICTGNQCSGPPEFGVRFSHLPSHQTWNPEKWFLGDNGHRLGIRFQARRELLNHRFLIAVITDHQSQVQGAPGWNTIRA